MPIRSEVVGSKKEKKKVLLLSAHSSKSYLFSGCYLTTGRRVGASVKLPVSTANCP